jgi:hypothetical protein
VNTIIDSVQQEDPKEGEPGARRARIYKGPAESRSELCRSIVTVVQLRVAPVKGPDPKLRNEFCPQASPSQVRDACGPRDANRQLNTHSSREKSITLCILGTLAL